MLHFEDPGLQLHGFRLLLTIVVSFFGVIGFTLGILPAPWIR